ECLQQYSFKKFENGIYYREASFESNPNVKLFLLEMPLYNGILRMDEVQTSQEVVLRLGHYALPELKQKIKLSKKRIKGYSVIIIDNGEHQLAVVALKGWEEIEARREKGLHPESRWSVVINTSTELKPTNGEHHVLTT